MCQRDVLMEIFAVAVHLEEFGRKLISPVLLNLKRRGLAHIVAKNLGHIMCKFEVGGGRSFSATSVQSSISSG
jgi:hypothetical protein